MRLAERQIRRLLADVPTVLEEMLRDKDGKKMARVTEAFSKMKKLDIRMLREAYEGRSGA